MSWLIFGKYLSIELRTGTGFDIEFCDSRPVWTQNNLTGESSQCLLKGGSCFCPVL